MDDTIRIGHRDHIYLISFSNLSNFYFSKFINRDELDSLFIIPYTTNELEVYDGCCLAVITIDLVAFADPAL